MAVTPLIKIHIAAYAACATGTQSECGAFLYNKDQWFVFATKVSMSLLQTGSGRNGTLLCVTHSARAHQLNHE